MRLHELAHRITWDVLQQVHRPEHRRVLLNYVLTGFDNEGQPIAHAPHQESWFRCLDCPRNSEECETCKEAILTHRTEKRDD
jgi:hypothetical protein